jgi:light-regulated signal transduction histidine kinase (bacteriophytochrome)
MGVESAIRDNAARDDAAEALVSARAENERLTARLERSNEEFTQILYAVSHDFAGPLQIVLSYSELLASRFASELDETGERFLAGIETGAKRIRELVNGLLGYSQLERYPLKPTGVECSEILDHTLEALASPIDEAAASISVDALPTITADLQELGRLFVNLLDNAIKFRSDDPLEIRVSAMEQRDDWCFSVRDNGIGIDPRHHERIFEIFQRLDAREQYPGTGTGLAICKKIVERHGGRIWVESRPGLGSTFHFTIPFMQRA